MTEKETKKIDGMAFELYATFKGLIPIGIESRVVMAAIAYLVADILLWCGCDANQSKDTMDAISDTVLEIMLREKEAQNQVN